MVVGTKGGDVMDDDDVGGVEPPSHGEVSFVSCSICLDLVTDNGERSRAKLQCGHEFHLGNLMHSILFLLGLVWIFILFFLEFGFWVLFVGCVGGGFGLNFWIFIVNEWLKWRFLGFFCVGWVEYGDSVGLVLLQWVWNFWNLVSGFFCWVCGWWRVVGLVSILVF